MVQVVGLEPTRSCPLRILSPVRLPFRHTWSVWRYHPDLNRGIKVLQTFALPLGDGTIKNKTLEVIFKNATNFLTLLSLSFFVFAFSRLISLLGWSGRRDSNSRHLPWQGNALPLSHFRKFHHIVIYSFDHIFDNCSFNISNFFLKIKRFSPIY